MSSPTRLFSIFLILTFAVLCQAPSTCGQSTDAKSKATGSISGRVTINGKAASGITVAAFGSDVPNRQSIVRTTTDSEGRYHLFGLAPAQYQITALAPSLVVADQSSYSGSYYGLGKSILLSATETVDDVDIKLAPGSVITGRITDSDGQPLIEQRVNLQTVDQNGNPTRQDQPYLSNYQMNQTDDRGVYRIYGLPSGRYRVRVGNDPNSRSMSTDSHGYYRLTFYPDVNDPTKATIVELNEGSEATNIDIRVGHRANTYVTTGHIVDSDTGQPAAVDSEGSFKLDGLEAGVYFVWANAPGFVSDVPLSPLEPRRFYHTGDSVTLTLIKSGVITGTVTTDSNAPVVSANVRAFRIRDENGKPVQGMIQFRDRLTDDRGLYRIYGLQPGAYVISAGGAGRFGWQNQNAYDNDAPTYAPSSTGDTATEVSIRSGEEATVDIQYRGDQGHAISGVVGGLSQTQSIMSANGTVTLTDARTRAMLMNVPAASFNNYTFAF